MTPTRRSPALSRANAGRARPGILVAACGHVSSSRSPADLPPLVSIVQVVTRDPALAREAVASVRAQGYERWELIVVIDGIADGRLAAELAADEDGSGRVMVVRLGAPRGPAAARNAGLALARGEFVTYLGEDDRLDDDHVSTLVAALASGEHQVAYVDCRRCVERWENGEPRPAEVEDPFAPTPFSRERLLVEDYLPLPTVMHRRACLDEVGGFDEALLIMDSWDLWIRLSRRYDFKRVPRVTCTVRLRERRTRAYRRERFPTTRFIHRRYQQEVAGDVALLGPRAQLLSRLERAHDQCAPEVSVVVVSHNQAPALQQGLGHLVAASQGVSCEILVVDNASEDETARFAMGLHGDVRPLVLTRPVTMAAAYNRGATQATAKRVVFWSLEVVPRPGWLQAMLAAMAQAVAVGGVILGAEGIVHAGFDLRPDGAVVPRAAGEPPWSLDASVVPEVDALGPGLLMVDAENFVAVGGFDEQFVGTSCFTDLSLRLRDRGAIRLQPRAGAYRLRSPVISPEDESRLQRRHASAPQTGDDVSALARRARDAMMGGQLREATALVKRLEAEAPQHPETWLVRAVLAMQLAEHETALESFAGALARGANAYRAKLGMGMALTASQRFEEAWAILSELSERFATESRLAHSLFRVGVALGRWGPMVGPLERYLRLNPGDDAMRFALASVCLRAGDHHLARSHYETLRQRTPDYRGLDELAAELTSHA